MLFFISGFQRDAQKRGESSEVRGRESIGCVWDACEREEGDSTFYKKRYTR